MSDVTLHRERALGRKILADRPVGILASTVTVRVLERRR